MSMIEALSIEYRCFVYTACFVVDMQADKAHEKYALQKQKKLYNKS